MKDRIGIENCAKTAGPGLINLPKDPHVLDDYLENSLNATSKDIHSPGEEKYLFVLFDTIKEEVVGTSGIYASVGKPVPFYAFRISFLAPVSIGFPPLQESRVLFQKCYQGGSSEICSLYLRPELRKEGLGRLLSFSRLLFMATFPERFALLILANMRGYTEKQISPFWEGVGRHFYDVPFEEVMNQRSINEGFLAEILPKYPIYVALLPIEVQRVIGKTHPHTQPAMNMLMHEGFQFINDIDPIDGGPILAGPRDEIRTVSESSVGRLVDIASRPIESPKYIISNNHLDFRACYGSLMYTPDNDITLTADIADALEVAIGDYVRYIAIPEKI